MDISAFRDRPDASGAMTVSELNNFIKNIFDTNRLLSSVSVRGEISNFKNHSSGHLYFSLKDEDGQIRAIMFRSAAYSLKFAPENGMKVTVRGSVSVYARDGSYQIYVTSMQPDGIGALYLAYEQLKARLESEGLFSEEYKKPIPLYPERVGVITSPTGAAVRDIINVMGRRCPFVKIYLYPALVQGDGAEQTLIEALEYFNSTALVDTVIIGRGGGSIEDLWAFNGEKLARAIFASKIPVISAVGHETDFTICDFVADLRAPTPSAAAELAVPDARELAMRVITAADRCESALTRLLDHNKERLLRVLASPTVASPSGVFSAYRERLELVSADIVTAYQRRLTDIRVDFASKVGKLEALSPLSVLARGYSVVTRDGVGISDVKGVSVGDDVRIRVNRGELVANVREIIL